MEMVRRRGSLIWLIKFVVCSYTDQHLLVTCPQWQRELQALLAIALNTVCCEGIVCSLPRRSSSFLINLFLRPKKTVLHTLGQKLKVRQQVIATAVVYFRRFFVKVPWYSFDPFLIVLTVM